MNTKRLFIWLNKYKKIPVEIDKVETQYGDIARRKSKFDLSLTQQQAALRIGLNNVLAGEEFSRWDCNAPGAKDCGVDNFPFCGLSGYKTIRCPFDSGTEELSGCWYRCSIEQETKESAIAQIQRILIEIDETLIKGG